MSDSVVSLPVRFNWCVPVRIVLQEFDTVAVFADAWDSEIPIPHPARELPADVSMRLRSGEPLIIAEARVDLGASVPEKVIGEIIRLLSVPSDKELGF